MRPGLIFWTAVVAFAIDQGSKFLVVHGMGLDQRRAIDVFPPFLNFRYGENRGINFGLLDSDADAARWVLIGFSLLVCAVVAIWAGRRADASGTVRVSAGLLIGGALGNVLDRLLYGHVLDFLNMSCCGISNPFVFNVADVFIFAGAVGLVLFDGRKDGGKQRQNAP